MATETAKDQLGLTDQLGDYVQGNVEPIIIATNRGKTNFRGNVISDPSGGSGSVIHPAEVWDSSR